MGIARFRVCIMSNWTTHHHLGGPIRVNEVSSNTVRLLIKTSEVEKKTLCLAPQPHTLTLTCSIPVFRPALLIYDAPPCADHLEREVACSTCPCPLSPTATWNGPNGDDAPMPVVSEMSVLALADLDVVLVLSHASASSAKGYPRQPNAMPVSGAFKGLHECKARCELGFGGWGRAGLKYIRTSYRLRFNRPIPLY